MIRAYATTALFMSILSTAGLMTAPNFEPATLDRIFLGALIISTAAGLVALKVRKA